MKSSGWQSVVIDGLVVAAVTVGMVLGVLPSEAAVGILASIVWAHASQRAQNGGGPGRTLPPASAAGLLLAGLLPRKR